ncbi:hypothetical protein PanWU01x14_042410 [Parasponia andersonii]|uniref:Uncharacterized protein n=1 Tax=Parasponia andersonii TaxID=3476 RepID=A0A2P5DQQ6_PARAD|nr:hypothetical protein PanWU01x14_042410 [Parasponia andersonii]
MAAKAEEEARIAAEKAWEAAVAAKKLEEEVKNLYEKEAQAASLAEEAQEKADAAGASFVDLFNKAKDIGSGFSWEKLSTQLAAHGFSWLRSDPEKMTGHSNEAKRRKEETRSHKEKRQISEMDSGEALSKSLRCNFMEVLVLEYLVMGLQLFSNECGWLFTVLYGFV